MTMKKTPANAGAFLGSVRVRGAPSRPRICADVSNLDCKLSAAAVAVIRLLLEHLATKVDDGFFH